MKIKFIVKLSVLSLLSTSVFAFKIISTEISHTGNISEFGFIESTEVISPQLAVATAYAKDAYGYVDSPIRVEGAHTIHIVNTFKEMKEYQYFYQVVCGEDAAYFKQSVYLNPNETYTTNMKSFMNVIRSYKSTFPIVATTIISGGETSSHSSKATLTTR